MNWKKGVDNFKQNLPLLVSFCGIACLNVFSVKAMLIAVIMIVAVSVLSFWKKPNWEFRGTASTVLALAWTIVAVFFAVRFYYQMQDNVMTLIFADYIGVSGQELALDLAIFGAVLAMTFVFYALVSMSSIQKSMAMETIPTRSLLITSFLVAFSIIGICSKSSPIYPFNDWVDSNCFMTVGKSMLHGMVPYRDLYEQKGPLLYMIHAVAALISDTTFLGVFVLEIVAATAFLSLFYRTAELFQKN